MYADRDPGCPSSVESPAATPTLTAANLQPPSFPRTARFTRGEIVAGRYQIEAFLGEGGVGQVFAAFDVALGHRIALKAVRPDIPISQAEPLVIREASAARRINHPGVCRVFDVCRHQTQQGPVLLLTMELVEGETLWKMIRRRGPLPLSEAWKWAHRIGQAMAAAHASGVVHRDLKSSNLIVSDDESSGRIVVTDFGIASLTAAGEAVRAQPGVGTRPYAPPEQFEGRPSTPASDIYAFAVVLCEMLIGRLPQDATIEDALARTLPRRRRAQRWRAVISRCLARDPESRFSSILAVLAALEPDRVPWPARRFATPAIVAAAIAGLAVFLFAPLQYRETTAQYSSAVILPLEPAGGGDDLPWMADAVTHMLALELERLGMTAWVAGPADGTLQGTSQMSSLLALRGFVAENAGQVVISLEDNTEPHHVRIVRRADVGFLACHSFSLARDVAAAMGTRTMEQRARAAEPGSRTRAWRWYAEGRRLAESQDLGAARDRLTRAIGEDESFAEAHVKLAEVLAARGASAAARSTAVRALDLVGEGTDVPTLEIEARAARAAGDSLRATRASRALCVMRPLEARYALDLAFSQISAEDLDGAAATLATIPAERLDPQLRLRRDLIEASLSARRSDSERQRAAAIRAEAAAAAAGDRIRRADALLERSEAEMNLGRLEEAARFADEARPLYDATGHRSGSTNAVTMLGVIEWRRGRGDRAAALFRRSMAMCRETGDDLNAVSVLINWGILDQYAGDLEAADHRSLQALALARRLGDRRTLARALNNLALVVVERGHYRRARELYAESLSIADHLGNLEGVASALTNLGSLDRQVGDLASANDRFVRAHQIALRLGEPFGVAIARANLAGAHMDRWELEEAETQIRLALTSAREAALPSLEAEVLAIRARLEFLRGSYTSSRQSLLEARNLKQRIGEQIGESTLLIGLARVALEEGQLSDARSFAVEARDAALAAGAFYDTARARLWEGRAAIRDGATDVARRVIDRAAAGLMIVEDEEISLLAGLARGELLSAEGHHQEAGCLLSDVAARAGASGFREIQVEAVAGWLSAGVACPRTEARPDACALEGAARRADVGWAANRLASVVTAKCDQTRLLALREERENRP